MKKLCTQTLGLDLILDNNIGKCVQCAIRTIGGIRGECMSLVESFHDVKFTNPQLNWLQTLRTGLHLL